MSKSTKKREKREPAKLLELIYDNKNKYEICIDEVGRGCLFGKTYIACVILPKDGSFDGKDIKDSKKFSSKTKIKEVSNYIKEHALYWCVEAIDSKIIDEVNILQAVMIGMHNCIKKAIDEFISKENGSINETMAIIDGNYFKPYRWFDKEKEVISELPFVTIEQGDAKYMGIAAASILAKVARDDYIVALCSQYPDLSLYYGLDSNMGYGTKKHLEGIQEHGITQWHRRSFGICKSFTDAEINHLTITTNA